VALLTLMAILLALALIPSVVRMIRRRRRVS